MSIIEVNRPEESTGSFRIRSKTFFLTYPKIADIENVEQLFLNSLAKSFGVVDDSNWGYVISKENHEDGTPHIHVYLEFKKAKGVFSQNKLAVKIDNANGETLTFNGRYEACRDKHFVIQYLLKSDDNLPLTNMNLPLLDGIYYDNIEEHLHATLLKSGFETALDVLMTEYPAVTIKSGALIVKNLELAAEHFKKKRFKKERIVRDLSEFEGVPKAVNEWMSSDNSTCLVLYGKSGSGKTELAKSILSEMGLDFILVRDLNELRAKNIHSGMGLILDDLDTSNKSRESLIHLLDNENSSQIRILYGIATIPAGTRKIFTTNYPESYTMGGKTELIRRMTLVKIKKSLYKTVETTTTKTKTKTTYYD